MKKQLIILALILAGLNVSAKTYEDFVAKDIDEVMHNSAIPLANDQYVCIFFTKEN